MTRKRKRRSSIVEIGNGPARIKIYTMNRRDGYPEFTLSWKEAGMRKTLSFSAMGEAAVDTLDRLVTAERPVTPSLTLVSPTLVQRSSTGPSPTFR